MSAARVAAGLQLEWLSAARLPELRVLLDDPKVAQPAGISLPFSRRESERYLQTRLRCAAEGLASSFVAVLDGNLCGAVTLHDMRQSGRRAEIGFWVGRPYWGRGLGAEIVSLAVQIGVLDFGLNCIEARCRGDNAAARRIFAGLGFVCIGSTFVRRHGTVDRFRWRRD